MTPKQSAARSQVDDVLDEIQTETEKLLSLLKGERHIGLVTWRAVVAQQGQSVIRALRPIVPADDKS